VKRANQKPIFRIEPQTEVKLNGVGTWTRGGGKGNGNKMYKGCTGKEGIK